MRPGLAIITTLVALTLCACTVKLHDTVGARCDATQLGTRGCHPGVEGCVRSACVACPHPPDVELVFVDDDRPTPDLSALTLGVLHGPYSLDAYGAPDSLARGRAVLAASTTLQLQYLYGYGAANPSPDAGTYDFASLDARLGGVIKATGGTAVLGLGGAPDRMLDTAPTDTNLSHRFGPSADHLADFQSLVTVVAQRYGTELPYAILGAMKDSPTVTPGQWDVDAYLDGGYLPLAAQLSSGFHFVKLGGPWLRIEGTGSDAGTTAGGASYTHELMLAADRAALVRFLERAGNTLSFVIVQRDAVDPADPRHLSAATNYTDAQLLEMTPLFGEAVTKVRDTIQSTLGGSKPLWVQSDFTNYRDGGVSPAYQAAYVASVIKWEMEAGASAFILSVPQQQVVDGGEEMVSKDGSMLRLFTNTKVRDGGYPYPAADVMAAVKQRFPPGTQLYPTRTDVPTLEALASSATLLLINKSPGRRELLVNCAPEPDTGAPYVLEPYEVRVFGR